MKKIDWRTGVSIPVPYRCKRYALPTELVPLSVLFILFLFLVCLLPQCFFVFLCVFACFYLGCFNYRFSFITIYLNFVVEPYFLFFFCLLYEWALLTLLFLSVFFFNLFLLFLCFCLFSITIISLLSCVEQARSVEPTLVLRLSLT